MGKSHPWLHMRRRLSELSQKYSLTDLPTNHNWESKFRQKGENVQGPFSFRNRGTTIKQEDASGRLFLWAVQAGAFGMLPTWEYVP